VAGQLREGLALPIRMWLHAHRAAKVRARRGCHKHSLACPPGPQATPNLTLDLAPALTRPTQERLALLEQQRLLVDAQRRKVERRAARAREAFTREADARAGGCTGCAGRGWRG
jgi:hypothetical protein